VVGDLAGNVEKIRQVFGQAVRAGADVIVTPELAVCGYPPEDLLLKGHFLEDNRRAIEQLAKECPGAAMVVGFAGSDKNKAYNCAALVRNGRVEKVYRKGLLPNYGVFDERRYFQSGSEAVVAEFNGLRVALTVCEDIWEIDWLAGFLSGQGRIDMVVNISASPFYVGRTEQRQAIISQCARKFNCAVAYCNLIGGQDELVFDGRSMFADSTGKIAATARAFDEDLLIADVAAGDGQKIAVTARGAAAQQPAGSVEETYLALVLGTRDYARKNGFGKMLLGLSGGIDSSITAAIAVEAVGAENVIGITMPSQFNSVETISDAELLGRNLGIEFHTIPIGPILESFDKSLHAMEGWNSSGIAYENLQARIRGCILMSLSNQFGALVLTTGNKSETAVGYSTLYGDTAGGFAVIKDVPKTVVYTLAEYINQKARRQIIPEAVITRAPSAELRPNQKDIDSLPDYDLLDRILKGYVEEDKSARELVDSGLPAEVVRRVILMVDRNEYKRRQSPPGVKITPKAFGRDRRLPITNHYNSGSKNS
jgi:NAD+ synthase (glutamine-hydrolysing)